MNKIKPRIVIFGVGGAGCNSVSHLLQESGVTDVEFVLCNTDAQALNEKQRKYNELINKINSPDQNKSTPNAQFIQLGPDITQGLGTGANPDLGKKAAQESIDRDMFSILNDADMVFVVAGMGGGTGTGAAPLIAAEAKNLGALVISIVNKPFAFEGKSRNICAESGIKEIKSVSDTTLIIENQNLLSMSNQLTLMVGAFEEANNILKLVVNTFRDLIYQEGLINLDYADISSVIKDSGDCAVIGTGFAGERDENIKLKNNEDYSYSETSSFSKHEEDRGLRAAKIALGSYLLKGNSINHAKNIIINISGGSDNLRLFEIESIVNHITQAANENTKIIFGTTVDSDLNANESIRVSVIATGIPEEKNENTYMVRNTGNRNINNLNEDESDGYVTINTKKEESSRSFLNKLFGKKD